jgi:hypothetical protein
LHRPRQKFCSANTDSEITNCAESHFDRYEIWFSWLNLSSSSSIQSRDRRDEIWQKTSSMTVSSTPHRKLIRLFISPPIKGLATIISRYISDARYSYNYLFVRVLMSRLLINAHVGFQGLPGANDANLLIYMSYFACQGTVNLSKTSQE